MTDSIATGTQLGMGILKRLGIPHEGVYEVEVTCSVGQPARVTVKRFALESDDIDSEITTYSLSANAGEGREGG